MKKWMFAALLSMAMLIVCVPVKMYAAENATTLTVENVYADPGSRVTVNVDISGNPGVLGATLTATWDDGLTLVGSSNGAAFSELTYLAPSRYTSGCNFVWYGSSLKNITDGTVLSLDFVVSETAKSGDNYCVNISYDERDVLDEDYNQVIAPCNP